MRQNVADMTARGDAVADQMETFMAENSVFPDVFQFRDVDTNHGTFGYIRIRTFSLSPVQFIPELERILGLVSQNGLIIDVRGNGGGIINSGERMLQLFSDHPVEAERLHFINTELTLDVAKSNALGSFASEWRRSIELSLLTAAVYSQGFPIESPNVTNAIGQRYNGNVILITDARCYSTTDIFAAGFQDNELGPILGVDDNTGAGGANVFTHDLVQTVLAGPDSPIEDLPNGANMRVAIRRTTRVGANAGLPLEDLGVIPDETHELTPQRCAERQPRPYQRSHTDFVRDVGAAPEHWHGDEPKNRLWAGKHCWDRTADGKLGWIALGPGRFGPAGGLGPRTKRSHVKP